MAPLRKEGDYHENPNPSHPLASTADSRGRSFGQSTDQRLEWLIDGTVVARGISRALRPGAEQTREFSVLTIAAYASTLGRSMAQQTLAHRHRDEHTVPSQIPLAEDGSLLHAKETREQIAQHELRLI